MKNLLSVAGIFLLALAVQSCQFMGPSVKGNGNVTEETRSISGFEKVKAATGLDVYLIPDSTEFVVVEADENLHEHIRTELKNNTLDIYVEGRIRWADKRTVKVHFRHLNELESSSGAIVRSEEVLKLKELELSASSGSQQYLSLATEKLISHCSSGAQIELSGHAEKAEMSASSGAQLNGDDFRVSDCSADVSSGAHIGVQVTDRLKAEASSGGSVSYHGQPSQTEVHSSSGGSISQNN